MCVSLSVVLRFRFDVFGLLLYCKFFCIEYSVDFLCIVNVVCLKGARNNARSSMVLPRERFAWFFGGC